MLKWKGVYKKETREYWGESMSEIKWHNEKDTEKTAQKLADLVQAGDVICLEGDLGAGKTTFTGYFAHALGINKAIKSPTFTIIREYQMGSLPLYHMDAYRLEETGAEGLGIEEYLEGDGVTVIEWPQFIKEDLETSYLWLTIHKESATERRISLAYNGGRGKELAAELLESLAE